MAVQDPQIEVGRMAINGLVHANSYRASTFNIVNGTPDRGLIVNFASPRKGRIRAIVLAVETFNTPKSFITMKIEKIDKIGAVTGIGLATTEFDIFDPASVPKAEQNPYLLLNQQDWFEVEMGQRLRISIEPDGTKACDFDLFASQTNCASFPFIESTADLTPTSKPGETMVMMVDYDTGSLDNFTKMTVPHGCWGGTITPISAAHTDFDGVGTDQWVGLQVRMTACFLYAFAPSGKQFSFELEGLNPFNFFTDCANMSFYSVSNKPIMLFDLPRSSIGQTGENNDAINSQIRIREVGPTVIEDLEAVLVQNIALLLNKRALAFSEITKASVHADGGSWGGNFGNHHSFGILISRIRDITGDEARLLSGFIDGFLPNDPNAAMISTLGAESGMPLMTITPADIPLAMQLAESLGEELSL